MASPVIQFKRGLLANLPGLRAGEPGFTTDSYDLYVGLTSETSTNKFFGSHRYWTKETTSAGSGINLVEGTSNGSDFITLAAPALVGAALTYYFPAVQGAVSSVLTNDGSGNLTWSSGSGNPVFTGIATFSDTTDNTLGNSNTGSVQIDGGLGIDKNVTIGAGLSVAGESYFIGTATFYGGTLNLGDSDTDNINVLGEFVSNLVPNTDDTYDIGNGTASKRWRHASFSGVGTFATGLVSNSVVVGTSLSSPTIKTATIQHSNGTEAVTIDALGNVGVSSNLTVSGNLYVNGSTTQVSTSSLTVEDRTIELGIVNGNAPSATTTWDLGVLFNYYQTSAKKSAVVWEQSVSRFVFGSEVSDGGGADNNSPQITFTSYAPIEISALWVNDCAGQSQVISCTGTERFLENITVDAGTF